ncbi:MAG TPA: prepilin-type N-terminal cleavage/methylation domain-containing protein [Phycisphaerales bacterium]|nr:prepilin-type N-terminal cleavage/methylation domain-containing protein [Phycisphaerales bacterium]
MSIRKSIRKGFTLVEILIVVVILGILAAIVVPQFTNATQDAQAGNIKAQLDTLNNQIELFRARNNQYPDLAGDAAWGDVDTTGTMIGDGYIKALPVNPFNGQSSVGDDAAANGWHLIDTNGDGQWDTLGATNFDEDPESDTFGEITPGAV